jgi:hypothetical protein
MMKKIRKRIPRDICNECNGKRKKWKCFRKDMDKCPNFEKDRFFKKDIWP